MARKRGRGRVGGGVGRRSGRGRGRGGGDSVGKFLAPHTGRQAAATANAEAGAEYNPEIRSKRQEAKGSRKREGDLGRWYAQLAADYQDAQTQGASALQSIQDTTTKQLGEAADRSSADQARLASEDEAFAKLTGGPKDTSGLSRIAEAGAAAQRSRVALNAPVAQEQANFVSRLGGDKSAARMRGIEARQEERDRRDKIISDLTAVRKEKGSARVVAKEKIRESDRDYATQIKQLRLAKQEARSAAQRAAADAAIARVEAARQAQSDVISARQAQERIGISRKNAATSARSQRATAKNYRQGGKSGALTPGERSTIRNQRQSAAALVHSEVTKNGPPRNAAAAAELEQIVVERGGNPREVRRAVTRLRKAQAQKNRAGYATRRIRSRKDAVPAGR